MQSNGFVPLPFPYSPLQIKLPIRVPTTLWMKSCFLNFLLVFLHSINVVKSMLKLELGSDVFKCMIFASNHSGWSSCFWKLGNWNIKRWEHCSFYTAFFKPPSCSFTTLLLRYMGGLNKKHSGTVTLCLKTEMEWQLSWSARRDSNALK